MELMYLLLFIAPVLGSLCHSNYWDSQLSDKYLVELSMTSTMHHKSRHMVYETQLPKPYRVVHEDEDGDNDGVDQDDLAWMNRGYEARAKNRARLRVTVDHHQQVQGVECG